MYAASYCKHTDPGLEWAPAKNSIPGDDGLWWGLGYQLQLRPHLVGSLSLNCNTGARDLRGQSRDEVDKKNSDTI